MVNTARDKRGTVALIGPFAKWTFPRTGPLSEACTAFWRELAITTSSTSSTVNGTFQELDPSAGFAHGGPISVARLYGRYLGMITHHLSHSLLLILFLFLVLLCLVRYLASIISRRNITLLVPAILDHVVYINVNDITSQS